MKRECVRARVKVELNGVLVAARVSDKERVDMQCSASCSCVIWKEKQNKKTRKV